MTIPAASANGRAASLVVFKFGGTSVGAPDRFQNVIQIVTEAAASARVVVINSALSQVTRQLDGALDALAADAASPRTVIERLLQALRKRHRQQAAQVLSPPAQMAYASIVEKRLARLHDAFDRMAADGVTPLGRDAVLATGEQLAVPMVALALRDAGLDAPLGDATGLVRTDATFGAAVVDVPASRHALCTWYEALPGNAVPVLAGFIGGTANGATTTLGFEGSDYSAALCAALLNADRLIRYTDVDGVYTRDPSVHADAVPIERMAMEDALQRTEAGALGMHPKTLRPLLDAGIPLSVRSIVDPDASGTTIIPKAQMASVPSS